MPQAFWGFLQINRSVEGQRLFQCVDDAIVLFYSTAVYDRTTNQE
jgi:hypothetical protein